MDLEETLLTSEGHPLVVMKYPDGRYFSNHPEFGQQLAIATYKQNAEGVEAVGSPAAITSSQFDDEVDVDDEDPPYAEWTNRELLVEAKGRGLKYSTPIKRSQLISLLEADDEDEEVEDDPKE